MRPKKVQERSEPNGGGGEVKATERCFCCRKGRGWGRKKTLKIFMFHIAGFRLLKCGNGIEKRMIES